MLLRFGLFTLDSETRQLSRGGDEIRLSPKAFNLLCLLVEERPRVIDKRELLARIWPDTHVVDANLNVLIGELRRALGDQTKEPRFIRTVHGTGYAFSGHAAAARLAGGAATERDALLAGVERAPLPAVGGRQPDRP